uniref:Uncharacterized protein n=1 Tax=Lactuca sativa TaxID=4236 RepID=A0A9R1WHM0_LACSA|nr:hypothetical protein LSAT_V11C100009120 [Lactuca sativa]
MSNVRLGLSLGPSYEKGKKFHECCPIRPKFINDSFLKLSNDENKMLECSFSYEEIKSAVLECGSEKASRPDSFTFKLLKSKWELIKMHLHNCIKKFKEVRSFQELKIA